MRRVIQAVMTTVVCSLAVGCGDSPPPPVAPSSPNLVVAYTPGDCDPDAIRLLINSLYVQAPAQARLKVFNDGLDKYKQQKPDAGWAKFTGVISGVLTDYGNGKLRDPAGVKTTGEAVSELINALYTCAGRTPPGDLTGPLTGDGGVALCLVSQQCTVLPSSKNFFATFPPNFFTEPALVTVQYAGGPFSTEFTEYAPGYHVTIVPYAAQANYDEQLPDYGQGRPNPPGGRATVGVCPAHPHPSLESLAVLRIPDAQFEGAEPTLLLPPFLAGAPLECHDPNEGEGGISQTASRDGLLSRVGRYALSLFTPRPAYAWDGGVGGLTELMSTFVAADPNPAATPAPNFTVTGTITDGSTQQPLHGAFVMVSVPGQGSIGNSSATTGTYFFNYQGTPSFQAGALATLTVQRVGYQTITQSFTIPATAGTTPLNFSLTPAPATNLFRATFENATSSTIPSPENGDWLLVSAEGGSTISVVPAPCLATTDTCPSTNALELHQVAGTGTDPRLQGRGPSPASTPSGVRYEWTATATSPSVFFVPAVVGNGVMDVQLRAGGQITVNSSTNVVPNVSWSQSVPLRFRVDLNVATQKASLYINGAPASGAQGLSYVLPTAVQLSTFGVNFGGVEQQTVVFDEISISAYP